MKYDLNNKDVISAFDEIPLWAAPFGLKLLDAIRLKKNITALDIGFGTGFPLLEIAQRLGNTSKVYGIDPWKAAIERTKNKIAIYGIKNVELIEGVSEKIPLPDNSIDLIVSNNGLNNVSDLNGSLKECSRIAKKEAQLVFSFNLEATMMEFYSVFEKVLKDYMLDECVVKMKEHIHTKRKPAGEWKSALEKNNFYIKNIREYSFEYKFSDGTSMLNHYFIKLAFKDSWTTLVPEEQRDKIFFLIEERLNEEAEKNRGMKLSVPFAIVDCVNEK